MLTVVHLSDESFSNDVKKCPIQKAQSQPKYPNTIGRRSWHFQPIKREQPNPAAYPLAAATILSPADVRGTGLKPKLLNLSWSQSQVSSTTRRRHPRGQFTLYLANEENGDTRLITGSNLLYRLRCWLSGLLGLNRHIARDIASEGGEREGETNMPPTYLTSLGRMVVSKAFSITTSMLSVFRVGAETNSGSGQQSGLKKIGH